MEGKRNLRKKQQTEANNFKITKSSAQPKESGSIALDTLNLGSAGYWAYLFISALGVVRSITGYLWHASLAQWIAEYRRLGRQ